MQMEMLRAVELSFVAILSDAVCVKPVIDLDRVHRREKMPIDAIAYLQWHAQECEPCFRGGSRDKSWLRGVSAIDSELESWQLGTYMNLGNRHQVIFVNLGSPNEQEVVKFLCPAGIRPCRELEGVMHK